MIASYINLNDLPSVSSTNFELAHAEVEKKLEERISSPGFMHRLRGGINIIENLYEYQPSRFKVLWTLLKKQDFLENLAFFDDLAQAFNFSDHDLGVLSKNLNFDGKKVEGLRKYMSRDMIIAFLLVKTIAHKKGYLPTLKLMKELFNDKDFLE